MLEQIVLEVSLKPFKRTDEEYIREVCERIFTQWKKLLEKAKSVSVMLFPADGSEILDYRGNDDDSFEWCKFVGVANPKLRIDRKHDPEGKGLHARGYLYTENPPVMTYGILKAIVQNLKAASKKIMGDIPVEVGTTFDPGPEFAISDFKYNRHNEICVSNDMGEKGMVYAMARLNADNVRYAGFPDGIPEGTYFATFFGRQCRIFLKDMGFDYIWFSNGTGFGRDTWNCCGALFDGESFNGESLGEIKDETLLFWKLFREECPDIPVRTRGTNMSMGIDLATDGVPLKDIYNGGFDMMAPPNSPWAAIDDDFGLELMGYMSRIAKLPDERFVFRYYLHDPWWINTPWYDRYGGWAHDIYLPLAICRLDESGKVCTPTHFNILTIDNSWGDMPDDCVYEPLPHMRKALKDMPDAPPPLVWVYPFEEYSGAKSKEDISQMYAQDWFIRGAVNNGLPIGGVTATDLFSAQDKAIYKASVIITPVPKKNSGFEKHILSYIKDGGRVIFYGNAEYAGDSFLELFGLRNVPPIDAEQRVTVDGRDKGIIKHSPVLSGGGLSQKGEGYAYAADRVIGVQKGNAVWIRGTVSCDCEKGSPLLKEHDPAKYFISETLAADAFARLGYEIVIDKPYDKMRSPVLVVSRCDNAYMFSVYNRTGAVKIKMKFPQGAPILPDFSAVMEDGYAVYTLPKAIHSECRVFVQQDGGAVSVEESSPVSYELRRRLEISGLENATVRVLGENYCKEELTAVLNSGGDKYVGEPFEASYVSINGDTYFEARNVSGRLIVSMPDRKEGKV